MQDAMLRAYERELGYFRDASLDFAAAHPAIGKHLGLEADAAVDPFVERLIEGAAFLAARVQLRLDHSVDHFANYVLDQLLPSVNAPIPSTALVRLDPGAVVSTITTPVMLPRGSTLRLVSNAARSRPLFLRTTHAITLRPLTVTDTGLLEGAAALRAAGLDAHIPRGADSALRVTWQVADAAQRTPLDLDELSLFLDGVGNAPYRTLSTLFTQTRKIVAVSVAKGVRRVIGSWDSQDIMELAALRHDSALLVEGETGLYAGFRLLEEYFVLPERFRMLSLKFGKPAVPASERIEVYFVFDRTMPSFASDLEQTSFIPYCVPVVNLFPRQLDRAPVDSAHGEVRLVVDRTRATDFEVVRVTGGNAYVAGHARGVPLVPLFASTQDDAGSEHNDLQFSAHREMLRAHPTEASQSSSVYLPSEVWMTLTGAHGPDLAQYTHVAAQALVSNRERCYEAVRNSGGYTLSLEDPLPVESVAFVVSPTPPQPAATGRESPWRLLGALRLNFFSLFGDAGSARPERLRAMLALFAEPQNRFAGSTIAGILGATVSTAVERMPGQGPLSFARGAAIVLDVDQNLADSGQYFVLGAILDVFLAGYASVNSFTRLTIRDARQHVLHRWPVRLGLHECL